MKLSLIFAGLCFVGLTILLIATNFGEVAILPGILAVGLICEGAMGGDDK